jgi:NADPH:quinone reductase-like Zn-dependent oxidoreductase
MKQTSNRGVDVILNSLTGDLLHDSWQAIAELGRFVEIGKRDIVDSGKLNMELFARSATFTAFDLACLYFSTNKAHHDIWRRFVFLTNFYILKLTSSKSHHRQPPAASGG